RNSATALPLPVGAEPCLRPRADRRGGEARWSRHPGRRRGSAPYTGSVAPAVARCLALLPPQGHDGRAVAAFVRGSGALRADRRVAAQVIAHRLLELAGAVAVDHAELLAGGEKRPVQVVVQAFQGRLDPLAEKV